MNVYAWHRSTNTTTLVSARNGAPANKDCELPLPSFNGQRVVFDSEATNLDPSDANAMPDVYWADTGSGQIERLSQTPPRSEGLDSDIYQVGLGGWIAKDPYYAISADGLKIALHWSPELPAANDTNLGPDVVLYDLQNGSRRRLSEAADGSEALGPGPSFTPVIAGDASRIAFQSLCTELVPNRVHSFLQRHDHPPLINNQAPDMLAIAQELDATLTALATEQTGAALGSDGGYPIPSLSISHDGQSVFWIHRNWAEGDALHPTAALPNYVRGLVFGLFPGNTIELISRTAAGTAPYINDFSLNLGFGCYRSVCSADGTQVAYDSSAADLTSQQIFDGTSRVYVFDRNAGKTTMVSTRTDGSPSLDASFVSDISADGRYVLFESHDAQLVHNDTNGRADLFLFDRSSNVTERVNLSGDGGELPFPSENAALSGNGRFVCFRTLARALPEDVDDVADLYLRDRQTDVLERITYPASVGPAREEISSGILLQGAPNEIEPGGLLGSRLVQECALSHEGRYVVYLSYTNDESGEDQAPGPDVYVYDAVRKVKCLVGRNLSTQSKFGRSWSVDISADGQWIVFDSSAPDLVADDTNKVADVFLAYNPLYVAP